MVTILRIDCGQLLKWDHTMQTTTVVSSLDTLVASVALSFDGSLFDNLRQRNGSRNVFVEAEPACTDLKATSDDAFNNSILQK